MKLINRAGMALLFSLSVAGCGNKGSGSGDEPAAGTGKGIDAPGNDPAVVALAKKVLTCKWSDAGFEYDCPTKKEWEESPLTKDGAADPTLVAMLEDPSEQVRWIAVNALSGKGSKYKTEKPLAERVMAAAETEKAKQVARNLAGVAGRIKLPETGLLDRGRAMMKSPTAKDIRLGFIGSAQFANSDALYEVTKELAKSDPEVDIRDAAMSAFWTGTPSAKNAEVCALWLDLSHDEKNEEFAAHAAYFAAFYPHSGGCKAQWDTMLGDIEKRAKAGTAKSSYWGSALYYLHNQNASTPAQKKRAIAVAKAMVENKGNSGSARVRAMELVAEKDPGGKAFLNKFTNDSDSYVKSRATDLLKKK